MDIKDFARQKPVFLPEKFFNGRLEGWLVFESLTGGLQRRGTIKAKGRWLPSQKTVQFVETWTLDGGHKDTLRWTIVKQKAGHYAGAETNIVGEAKGEQAGCAFHWTYTRNTPQPGGRSIKLSFNDWFFMIDKRVAIVRGTASKFGVPFATAHVVYRKLGR